jgi:hypothetical protein
MQTTSFAERRQSAAAAERSNAERRAALAVNELLTIAQANVLKLAMDAMPEAAVLIAEQAFEAYGWPSDDLDANWLDDAGRVTWAVFQRYRSAGAA